MKWLKVSWRWLELLILLLSATSISVALRNTLTFANITLIYTLIVLITAVRSGTWVAFAGSFASFLCINFFLVQPYYTFTIEDRAK
ncbi:MAG: DUF4118 domain-containing protein [Blastochloris sp.]|nr:DUF4118 domain-containing protein [Blastochloris sp.]